MSKELQSANFKYLYNAFIHWLKTLDRSEGTISNYPMGLKEYFWYLEKHYRISHIDHIKQKHVEAFKEHLQTRVNQTFGCGGLSNQSINSIISGINSFNLFITQHSPDSNYVITADYLPITSAERIVLTQKEVLKLYNATFEPYPHSRSSLEFGQRDRVILALLYGSGLRLSEAANLDLSDIDFINKRGLVRKGKRSKQRFVPIANQNLEDIRAYIQQGRYYFTERHHVPNWKDKNQKKAAYQADEQALLLSIEGTRLMHFAKRLEYLRDKAYITKAVTPHVLRHSYATHLCQSGLDLDKIRKILGHSSIDTTQIYVHICKQLEHNNTETE
jgi:integrase/recombinase XerD